MRNNASKIYIMIFLKIIVPKIFFFTILRYAKEKQNFCKFSAPLDQNLDELLNKMVLGIIQEVHAISLIPLVNIVWICRSIKKGLISRIKQLYNTDFRWTC